MPAHGRDRGFSRGGDFCGRDGGAPGWDRRQRDYYGGRDTRGFLPRPYGQGPDDRCRSLHASVRPRGADAPPELSPESAALSHEQTSSDASPEQNHVTRQVTVRAQHREA